MKSTLQDMPPKQKIMIGVTAIVILIVIWQVVGLFGGGESTSVPNKPIRTQIAKMSANVPGAGGMHPAGAPGQQQPLANPNAPVPTAASGEAPVVKEAPINRDQYLQEQDKVERKYLKQLNDLEQLKLERQIEETNQAIAVAKLATVTAEKSTAELLTKPAAAPAPVADSSYANQLASPTKSGTSVEGEPSQPTPPPAAPQAVPDAIYSVISVSMQFNKWTAVIGSQGKLYNVTVGDVLPLDGSVVVSISKNGVVLKKDDQRRKVSITAAI